MTAVSTLPLSVDTPAVPNIAAVDISAIRIPSDHRKHHRDAIQAFAEDIDLHGLRQPVEVLREGDGYRLVFGRLRLEAHAFLDLPSIAAIVKEPHEFKSEAGPRLASISENLLRNPLNALQRSLAIADWCGIYRAAQPDMKPGRKPAQTDTGELGAIIALNSDEEKIELGERFAATFSDAAQSFLGISRRSVFNALKIASIPSLQRERIELHGIADQLVELLALAKIDRPDRQVAAIDLILANSLTVEEALARIDQRPLKLTARWEKLTEKFTRLHESEQDRFFDLNEASVTRWVAKRGRK